MKKECPPDKILNPETKRCVSKTGAIGKKLMKEKKQKSKSPKKETKNNIDDFIEKINETQDKLLNENKNYIKIEYKLNTYIKYNKYIEKIYKSTKKYKVENDILFNVLHIYNVDKNIYIIISFDVFFKNYYLCEVMTYNYYTTKKIKALSNFNKELLFFKDELEKDNLIYKKYTYKAQTPTVTLFSIAKYYLTKPQIMRLANKSKIDHLVLEDDYYTYSFTVITKFVNNCYVYECEILKKL